MELGYSLTGTQGFTVRLGIDAEGFEASLLLWLCCTVVLVRQRQSRDRTTQ